ncbi:MAG TPA: IS1595 family transposase [Terriglobia bacterium]|nr:IS1595 family transposase [Terriglobia bacterium]
MMNTNDTPKTLLEAIKFFDNYENCKRYMMKVRWPDGVVRCPECNSDHVTYLENARVWKCYAGHPRPKFSLKVGTIFEDSSLPLQKWLPAVWMLANCKNGISSYELHRALGVTQKSAWFMLHRIRKAMQSGSFMKLDGEVEVDETFIGGKARNMHKEKRDAAISGTGGKDKTAAMGFLERGGPVTATVIADRKKRTLQGLVKSHVKAGAALYTDALASYDGLDGEFFHKVVDHAVEYVNGNAHTNGLENFWSLLKRSLKGTYVSVAPFHLFRYLDEQSFRYNQRKTDDFARFVAVLATVVNRRLTYTKLIGATV